MTAAKIAVTVPRETLDAVEKRRRTLGMSRSAAVTAALESWLQDATMSDEERRYLLAHLRQPETVSELRDGRVIAAAAAATWEPWDSEPKAKPKKTRSRKA